jgi:hypothetical protein
MELVGENGRRRDQWKTYEDDSNLGSHCEGVIEECRRIGVNGVYEEE